MSARRVLTLCLAMMLASLLPIGGVRGAPPDAGARTQEIRRLLAALEDARQAGILSDEEFARKKAALDAELAKLSAAPSPEIRRKLEALEAARAAGVLTEDEYRRKRGEILAGGRAPETPEAAPMGPSRRFLLTSAGLSIVHPADWIPRRLRDGKGVALVRGRASLSLLLSEGRGTSREALEEIRAQIGDQWRDVRDLGESDREMTGGTARIVEFTGTNPRGLAARARVAALVARGTNHVFFLVAPLEEFGSAVPVWDVVLDGLRREVAPEPRRDGQTFQHPIGFQFWYPAGWTARTTEDGGILLVPPDLVRRDGDPMEYYVVGAAELPEGATGPGKAEVLGEAQAVEMLRRQIPGLVGDPTVRVFDMAGGKGIVVDCRLRIETVLARVRMYLTIVGTRAAALIAVALPELIEKRHDDVERVFSSFVFGRPARSTDVVGRWSLSKSYSSGSHEVPVTWQAADGSLQVQSGRGVSVVSSDDRTVEFRADGTFTETRKEMFLAMGGYNPITGGSIVLGSDEPTVTVTRGRWRAGNGTLCLMADDGSCALAEYRVETSAGGRRMLVRTDGRLEVWISS